MDIVERLRGAYSTVFERSLAREAADTIRQQAERIRELEATEARYYALLELDSSDVMVDVLNRAEAVEQQLAEVVEYAGKLREKVEYTANGPIEDYWRLHLKRMLEALPLPKAMQENKNVPDAG